LRKTAASIVVFALLVFGVSPANAQDAYNPDIIPPAQGTAIFQVGEEGASIHYSKLFAQNRSGATTATCDSVTDTDCSSSKVDGIVASSILKVCSSSSENNCVLRLEMAGADGVFHQASFVRNANGMQFPANSSTGYSGATTPALFSIPQVPSASGTTDYAVIVRAESRLDWSEGKFKTSGVFASVRPFRAQAGNYQAPFQAITEKNHRGDKGLAIGAHGYECAWSENGTCGVLQDFAANTRVRLTIRITSDVGGWFKGRIKNPLISVSRPRSDMNEITVEAAPAEVARMVYKTSIADLTPTEREYGMLNGMAGSWDSQFISWAGASYSSTFGYLNYLRTKVKDTTSGSNTYWNFSSSGQQSGNSCLADTSQVLGIVTTNSMAYNGGAPQFRNGFLNYEVAGLHYQPDGITKVQGSYDLVIRSEVARCLYGFSRAPLSATISVIGEGDRSIATTVVNEKNGWLKLAAYGFTFSKKTIRAKITKAKPTRLVCVSVADESKVRNVRAINPKCPKGFKPRA
jgi:hypothetical protein